MPLVVGDKLGHYEILSLLGKGGMGEVYRGRDTKLKRDVAIKVLPEAFARNPERMARFQREAEVLASLNHSNIAAIYGVEDHALVMELVEGNSPKGPLSFDDAWRIASQVVAALEYAHERGIVHRDLKPANILVTSEKVVKLLDFGLAKAFSNQREPSANPENSPTLTLGATEVGVILGTAAYMAPEQARGKAVDKRADIWAFGVVIWELFTGERLFQGESTADILGKVLEGEIDLSRLPERVRRLLARCLERDVKNRLRDIGDARFLLDATQTSLSPPRLRWLWPAIATMVMLTLGALAFVHFREQAEERPLVRLDIALGADVSLPVGNFLGSEALRGGSVAISPDGTRLAYLSGSPIRIFSRRLDQSKATEFPGTQGAVGLFFSPDGKWIGFATVNKLNKVSVEGGAVVPLADVSGFRGASWGEDGNIITADSLRGLLRVPAAGGPAEMVLERATEERLLASPQLLPGGKAVLFTSVTDGALASGNSIQSLTLRDRRRRMVVQGGSSPRFLTTKTGTGYLTYTNQATLFAVPFDVDKLETRGTAVPVLDDVASAGRGTIGQFDFSHTGTLIYRRGRIDQAGVVVKWIEAGGKTEPLLAKPGIYARPILSPDGQRLALVLAGDIWIYDWKRDTMTRLTFTGAGANIWSPDGRYIVFSAPGGMYWMRSDGAGKLQSLTQSNDPQNPISFAPDGKLMAFDVPTGKAGYDMWTVPIESSNAGLRAGKPELFLRTPANNRSPTISPDGHWLAYISDESGTYQLYVRSFPDKGGKWQISNSSVTFPPMWSRTSHELFFETLDTRQIMVAPFTVKGDSFVAEKPRLWSDTKLADLGGARNVGIAPDGKRFAAFMPAVRPEDQQAQNQVVFLMNFFDELRRRVPVGK